MLHIKTYYTLKNDYTFSTFNENSTKLKLGKT